MNLCEAWGNTYKSRIQPLYIIQKKAIRICGNVDSRSHTKPLFYQWKTLGIYDIVNFYSMDMVFMFKVYANLFPANLLSLFLKVNDSHNRSTRKNNNTFKIRFTRTTQKSCNYMCKRAKDVEYSEQMIMILKLCKTTVQFKKKYFAFFFFRFNLVTQT